MLQSVFIGKFLQSLKVKGVLKWGETEVVSVDQVMLKSRIDVEGGG